MGHVVKMIIKKFEPKYRDDLIFMILEAKNSLGRIPGLNEDLLKFVEKQNTLWRLYIWITK